MGSIRVMRLCWWRWPGWGLLILAPSEFAFGGGACLGMFIGPSILGAGLRGTRCTAPRASPFGLMMFSGKATSFVGPLLCGVLVTRRAPSGRA